MLSDDPMNDDAAWDAIIRFCLQFGAAALLGFIVFLDVIVLDVHYSRAALVAGLLTILLFMQVGVWTLRKVVLALTLYSAGYLIGAFPPVHNVGSYLSRLLS